MEKVVVSRLLCASLFIVGLFLLASLNLTHITTTGFAISSPISSSSASSRNSFIFGFVLVLISLLLFIRAKK